MAIVAQRSRRARVVRDFPSAAHAPSLPPLEVPGVRAYWSRLGAALPTFANIRMWPNEHAHCACELRASSGRSARIGARERLVVQDLRQPAARSDGFA